MMAHFTRKCKYLFIAATLVLVASCREAPVQPGGQETSGWNSPEPYRPQEYAAGGRGGAFSSGGGGFASAPASAGGQVVKVALLVPLSGENAKLGNLLLDGATLALFDKYESLPASAKANQIILLPKDTGNTPQGAEAAAHQAIEEGAQLILGPLFAKSVEAVAPIARQHNISVISFSNDRSVAGSGVYNAGFLPEQQVERITSFMYSKGYERIAALLPSSPYGDAVSAELNAVAATRAKHISPLISYPTSQSSMDAVVARLLSESTTTGGLFQALYVAEGEGRLKQIADALRRQGVDLNRVRLIGGGTFDNPDFVRDPAMAGSLFASVTPEQYLGFEQRFFAKYGYKPVKLAGLAYDAVALAATLALAPQGADFSKETISSKSGYAGPANGLFRFRSDGTCERGLAVIEITPAGFVVRDAAPTSF